MSLREAAQNAVETIRRKSAERRLWGEATSFQELANLTARWCEGELGDTPNHGERDPETVEVATQLAQANRAGFLTNCSQPGCRSRQSDGRLWEQRAAVDGFARPEVVERLRALVAGTRLVIVVRPPGGWRTDYSTAVRVTQVDGHEHTGFGGTYSRRAVASMFDGVRSDVVDQVTSAEQVLIYDPHWGESGLLWERLKQISPAAATPAPALPSARTTPKSTTSQGAGSGMPSIEEVRAQVAMANDMGTQNAGGVQHIIDGIDGQIAVLQAATEGTNQSDAQDAISALLAAKQHFEDGQGMLFSGIQMSEFIGVRL